MDKVKEIWEDLQRPSVTVLLRELRRQKIKVSEAAVRAMVNKQTSSQVFHPGPRSNGHIVAFAPHSVYQLDILGQSGRDPKRNDGYRFGLVCVDAYSRRVAGLPLRSKAPAETLPAFRRLCTSLGGEPKTLYTDEGGEFQGSFAAFLQERERFFTYREMCGTQMPWPWSTR